MLIQGRNVVGRCASVNDLRTKRFYNSAYISLRNWRDFTVPPNENPNDAEAFTHSVIRKTENETGAVNSVSGFCCTAWLPFCPVRVYACWLAVVMTPMRDLLLERESGTCAWNLARKTAAAAAPAAATAAEHTRGRVGRSDVRQSRTIVVDRSSSRRRRGRQAEAGGRRAPNAIRRETAATEKIAFVTAHPK